MDEKPARLVTRVRDVEREAREFLDYHLLPMHKLVTRLEDGDIPTFSPQLLTPPASGTRARDAHRYAPARLLEQDPEFHAAVEKLRRTLWFRVRFAWARVREPGRFPA